MTKRDALKLRTRDEVGIKSVGKDEAPSYGIILGITLAKEITTNKEVVAVDVMLHSGEYVRAVRHKDLI